MRRARTRRLLTVVAAAVLTLSATACDPIENAPPGGGEVIVENYRIGPFNLAAAGQPGSESESAQASVPRPAGAFGMKAIDFDIVDAAGNPVGHQAVHMHHVVLMNRARQSQFCSNWPERFAASGSERTPIRFPDPYAYMVGANEGWSALWHIMNESSTARQVYIQYKVAYQPGATAQNTRGVTPFFLDVTGCGTSEYDIPGDGGAGSVHTATRTWSMPVGRLHGRRRRPPPRRWHRHRPPRRGHPPAVHHDGALRAQPRVPRCPRLHRHVPVHLEVDAGQRFSLVSRYENSEPIAGAMGISMAFAWQGDQ